MLLFSALLYLLLAIVQMPRLKQSNDLFFSYDANEWVFFGSLATSALFVFSRLVLGYIVYLRKPIAPWLFCCLCLLTLLSGGLGFVLAVAALLVRFWPENSEL
tara:strand:+ start:1125 stop:1433 length:309 start_codon:yes stop_codon:yes gene_type:complete